MKAFAEQHRVSTTSEGVRVFRARAALKKRAVASYGTCAEHGCFNRTCRGAPVSGNRTESGAMRC